MWSCLLFSMDDRIGKLTVKSKKQIVLVYLPSFVTSISKINWFRVSFYFLFCLFDCFCLVFSLRMVMKTRLIVLVEGPSEVLQSSQQEIIPSVVASLY